MIVNLALYMPLGMAGHLVFRKWRVPGAGYWAPILLGALLSASIEMVQVFVPLRNTSLNDFVNNVIGTVLGVLAGALFEAIAGPSFLEGIHFRAKNRSALLLVFTWTAYLFFPVFPINSFHAPLQKLRVFVLSPVFSPVLLVSGIATWYIAGKLLASAGIRHPLRWLGLMLIAFPAQLSLVGRQPVRAALLGAIAGTLLYLFTEGITKRVTGIDAWLFLAVIVFRGLYPFHFAAGHPFSWMPFSGFLATEWESGAMVLLEKAFYYGTAVWLFRAAGMRMMHAAALVAAVLAAIEVLQTHQPGRVAEITDPILALGMAFALAMLGRERKPHPTATRKLQPKLA
jgi:VanZ family protein